MVLARFVDPQRDTTRPHVVVPATSARPLPRRAAGLPDGTVLGYAGLLVVLDEGYITNVAVCPDYRRQGIAGELLGVFQRFAEGKQLAFLTLEVRESNAPARALYTKYGYKEVGVRKNYYDHPKENAILMTREFAQ